MIKLQSNCTKFPYSLIAICIDIFVSIKISIPDSMDVFHYVHKPFTATIILKTLVPNRNFQTLELRIEHFKIWRHWSLSISIFHIYLPTIYNINQRWKIHLQSIKKFQNLVKSNLHLNFIKPSIITSFFIIIFYSYYQ